MKGHNLAIEYAQRALKINNKNGLAYITLAETYAIAGDEEGFYKNAELAMKCGFPFWEQLDEPAYERYTNQKRLKTIVQKYRR